MKSSAPLSNFPMSAYCVYYASEDAVSGQERGDTGDYDDDYD